MIEAAGILLKSGNSILLIKRSADSDMPGTWCFPGGKIEEGETPLDAAIRETQEEIGFDANSAEPIKRKIWIRSQLNDVDFTTFIQLVPEKFPVTLNDEHTKAKWIDLDDLDDADLPNTRLHPGAKLAIDRFSMDELQVAQAIVSGELTSPQHLDSFSLFDMRITGSGVSYRAGLKEFVYRDPALYLNDHFLARCNGLAVILDHPKRGTLNSDEFADRMAGMICLSYIKNEEVWGIAKIYDAATILILEDETLSTSPAVVFKSASEGDKVILDDGSVFLIEGRPMLLDHLAICEQGVWDKGGAPTGILSETVTDGADTMSEAQEKVGETEEVKNNTYDDSAAKRFDAAMEKLDSLHKRFDAMNTRKDAEPKVPETTKTDTDGDMPDETMADAARKDAEEAKRRTDAEEEKKREDKARMDAEEMRKRIDELESRVPAPMSDEERGQFADAQGRADSVYSAFGKAASHPMVGEGLLAYRRRLAAGLKQHSKDWSTVDLSRLDSVAFDVVEKSIYADAQVAAHSTADLPAGQMRTITKTDETGRRIREFVGRPSDWMSTFSARRRKVAGFNRNPGGSR